MGRVNPSVIVIGAGPAGAAAALDLSRRGHRVLLAERSGSHDSRIGETLLPETNQFLRNLGVWSRFLADGHVPSPATHSAWGAPARHSTDHLFNAHGPGWHIDRSRFDAMLASAAEEAGAQVWRAARVVSVSREDGRWRAVLMQGEGRSEVEATFLLVATGAGGGLARSLGTRWVRYDRLVGLVGVMRAETTIPSIPEVLAVESVEHGWWYSAPLPEGSLIAVHMTDADLVGRDASATFLARLRLTTHTRERARGFRLEGRVRVRKAGTGRRATLSGPGWLAIGDAATAYDPLSGKGITKALQDAVKAAACLDSGAHHDTSFDEYRSAVAARFERYLVQRAAYYRLEARGPQSPFWRRRQDPHC